MPTLSAQPNAAPPTPVESLLATLHKLATAQADLRTAMVDQEQAMRKLDVRAMSAAARRQETLHRVLLRHEAERRKHARGVARMTNLPPDATLAVLAEACPEHRDALLQVRGELLEATRLTRSAGQTCGRMAGGVLAHLNQALRLLHKPFLYSRQGDCPPAGGVAKHVRLVG
ncbi:MAG: flagellar export chaperone FlgN [Planctomycetota bacterium]